MIKPFSFLPCNLKIRFEFIQKRSFPNHGKNLLKINLIPPYYKNRIN